jgi:hypothetical protein
VPVAGLLASDRLPDADRWSTCRVPDFRCPGRCGLIPQRLPRLGRAGPHPTCVLSEIGCSRCALNPHSLRRSRASSQRPLARQLTGAQSNRQVVANGLDGLIGSVPTARS